jgi:hypothetical protein
MNPVPCTVFQLNRPNELNRLKKPFFTLYPAPFFHPTCLYKILPANLSTGIGNVLKTG